MSIQELNGVLAYFFLALLEIRGVKLIKAIIAPRQDIAEIRQRAGRASRRPTFLSDEMPHIRPRIKRFHITSNTHLRVRPAQLFKIFTEPQLQRLSGDR